MWIILASIRCKHKLFMYIRRYYILIIVPATWRTYLSAFFHSMPILQDGNCMKWEGGDYTSSVIQVQVSAGSKTCPLC